MMSATTCRIDSRISKRNHALIDFDRHRIQSKSSDDAKGDRLASTEYKLVKERAALETSRRIFMEYNEALKSKLPIFLSEAEKLLIDLEVGVKEFIANELGPMIDSSMSQIRDKIGLGETASVAVKDQLDALLREIEHPSDVHPGVSDVTACPTASAIFDYSAQSSDEIDIHAGQILGIVSNRSDEHALSKAASESTLVRDPLGRSGYVPTSYLHLK